MIFTSCNANTNIIQAQLVERLQYGDKSVIVTAMRNPYDLIVFPEVDTFVNVYSYLDISVNALSKVLLGINDPTGILPVSLPDLYFLGMG